MHHNYNLCLRFKSIDTSLFTLYCYFAVLYIYCIISDILYSNLTVVLYRNIVYLLYCSCHSFNAVNCFLCNNQNYDAILIILEDLLPVHMTLLHYINRTLLRCIFCICCLYCFCCNLHLLNVKCRHMLLRGP